MVGADTMVLVGPLFTLYIDELFEDNVSARLVEEAFMTWESPLVPGSLLGEGSGFSLASLSLSLEIPMCFGRRPLNPFKPFLDSFSGPSTGDVAVRCVILLVKAELAAVAEALFPTSPFRY